MDIYNRPQVAYNPVPGRRTKTCLGQTFHKLTPIGFYGHRNWRSYWLFRCECGQFAVIDANLAKSGNTHSCGCVHRKNVKAMRVTHGETAKGVMSSEYRAYHQARNRCNNSNVPNYKYYGGRGIQFRFTTFEQFLAEVGRKPSPKHSLDRINNDGNYEPGNLRWATHSQQVRNRQRRTKYDCC